MKKKSILGRVGIVAAALMLATTSMMSGTLARYQTSKDITASALIAKWNPSITASGTGATKGGSTGEEWTIKLAETIKSDGSDLSGNAALVGSSGWDRIAPGTAGYVDIIVDTKAAEVPTICTMQIKKADGTITIPEHLTLKLTDVPSGSGSPHQYGETLQAKWDDEDYESWSLPAYLVGNDGTNNTTNKAIRFKSVRESPKATTTKTFRLSWEWPLDYNGDNYSDGDAGTYNGYDTQLAASDVSKEFGFKLSVVLQQQGGSTTEGSDKFETLPDQP